MTTKVEFRNVLALIIVLCSFAFLFLTLFVKVPKENEALINVISGAVLVGGVGAIIGYFYGSSKAQNDRKLDLVDNIINPIQEDTNISNQEKI